jgi:hypothetical protein
MAHPTGRPPFHLELRTAGNRFITDEPCETAEIAARSFEAIAHLSGPGVYGPDGTHRLVIPAGREPLYAPDEAAWQASAARRAPLVDPTGLRGAPRAAANFLNKQGRA